MKKGRILALALVATLSIGAVLAGTYAWQSVNQKQRNAYRGTTSSGGRLHDDFNGLNAYSATRGAGDQKVKKVYAENFTDPANGGLPIYARIRLSEYLELGVGAGKAGATNRVPENLTIVGKNTTHTPELNTKSTWIPYLWGQTGLIDSDASAAFREYIAITSKMTDTTTAGIGKTVYLPTYNMDKDSAAADINGTLEGNDGKVETTTDAYGDYVAYTDNQDVWGVEVTALNEKGDDEMKTAGVTVEQLRDAVMSINPAGNKTLKLAMGTTQIDVLGDGSITYNIKENRGDGTHIENFYIDFVDDADGVWDVEVNVPTTAHAAKETAETAGIISMETWMKTEAEGGKGKQPGNYWVYDTDGWVYWANPIKPGETTGCLIDGISMASATKPTGEYYYGLDVQAQFATAGDWGSTGATSNDSFKGDITSNAIKLLNTVSGVNTAAYDLTITRDGTGEVQQGSQMKFQVDVKKAADSSIPTDLDTKLEWSVEGSRIGRALDTKKTAIEKDSNDPTKATLQIGEEETATDLTVIATYTDEDDVEWSAEWKLSANELAIRPMEYTVTVTASGTVIQGGTVNYTAAVTKKQDSSAVSDATVTWSLGGTASDTENTKINASTGVLTISETETSTDLKAIATYHDAINNTNSSGETEVGTIEKATFQLTITRADATKPAKGSTHTFQASLKRTNPTDATDSEKTITGLTYEVTGRNDSSTNFNGNKLTIGSNETATELKVTATCTAPNGTSCTSNELTLNLKSKLQQELETIAAGSASTVRIDGIEFYVAYKNDTQALLWSKLPIAGKTMTFGSNNKWSGSGVESYLNGEFLTTNTNIAAVAKETTIYTRDSYNGSTYTMATKNKVFLLSEEDVFGTANGSTFNGDGKAYTAGMSLKDTIATNQLKWDYSSTGTESCCWLRSPYSNTYSVANLYYNGTLGTDNYGYTYGVRPAFWVDL